MIFTTFTAKQAERVAAIRREKLERMVFDPTFTPMCGMKGPKKSTPAQIKARTKRQMQTAKRRVAALKGKRNSVRRNYTFAMLWHRFPGMRALFADHMNSLPDKEYREARKEFLAIRRAYYALVPAGHPPGLDQDRRDMRQFGGRRYVPGSRNSIFDWRRPLEKGQRISLSGALSNHMTDTEVEYWSEQKNGYGGRAYVSRETYAIHSMKEPLTYANALSHYASDLHWGQDWENYLQDTLVYVLWYDKERRDLRSRRYETDGRKKSAKPKFTTKNPKHYFIWLCKQLHDIHKRGWPKAMHQFFELQGEQNIIAHVDGTNRYGGNTRKHKVK